MAIGNQLYLSQLVKCIFLSHHHMYLITDSDKTWQELQILSTVTLYYMSQTKRDFLDQLVSKFSYLSGLSPTHFMKVTLIKCLKVIGLEGRSLGS